MWSKAKSTTGSLPCEWGNRLTERPAILEVATLKGMLGIGPAKVSWPRSSVGYGSLAFERDRAVMADWYFYRTANDALKGTHQPKLPVAKHQSKRPEAPSVYHHTACPVGLGPFKTLSFGISTCWP
jgi:hypothetical protein